MNATIWRGGMVFATLVGLAIAVHAIAPLSTTTITHLLDGLGWPGFLTYVFCSLLVFVVLGAAWLVVMGAPWSELPAFVWARMLREAASDLLPFSQIGGIVEGADSLIARGLPGASVYASMTADLTTEMVSQVLFTLLGIGLFAFTWLGVTDTPWLSAIAVGLVVIALIAVAARTAPTWIPVIAPKLLERLAPNALATVNDMAVQLGQMYGRHARMFAATVLNFIAWLMSVTGSWIVLYWIGSDLSWTRVLSLEAFIFALRSVAFMVPGSIGVQEVGYALTAPLFGLPVEAALVLAIAKRCRDLAMGLPTLLVWQMTETRTLALALRRMKASRTAPDIRR